MNFSTVFLLLIVTHFSNSMKSAPRQQRMKRENSTKESGSKKFIPLDLPNDDRKFKVLKKYSFEFRNSFVKKIKNNASTIISSIYKKRDGYGICKPSKSHPELFIKGSLEKCKQYCSRKNKEIVEALNKKILQLINHLFCDTSLYDVQLTVINDDIGNCVKSKKGDSKCEYKVKFKFFVSEELNNLLNFVLKQSENMEFNKNLLSDQQLYLTAAIISIETYPRFARYYIPWLLRRLKTCSETPAPIPKENYQNYQPSSRRPFRNPNLYFSRYESEVSSHHLNPPHSQRISRSNYPPNHHSSSNYKYFFDPSTSSSRDRRRTTYYTSSSYYDTNESNDTTVQENDDAGNVEDNGGVVEENSSLMDIGLWGDLQELFTCDCTSSNCNFNCDYLTDIDCTCLIDTDCSFLEDICTDKCMEALLKIVEVTCKYICCIIFYVLAGDSDIQIDF